MNIKYSAVNFSLSFHENIKIYNKIALIIINYTYPTRERYNHVLLMLLKGYLVTWIN